MSVRLFACRERETRWKSDYRAAVIRNERFIGRSLRSLRAFSEAVPCHERAFGFPLGKTKAECQSKVRKRLPIRSYAFFGSWWAGGLPPWGPFF